MYVKKAYSKLSIQRDQISVPLLFDSLSFTRWHCLRIRPGLDEGHWFAGAPPGGNFCHKVTQGRTLAVARRASVQWSAGRCEGTRHLAIVHHTEARRCLTLGHTRGPGAAWYGIPASDLSSPLPVCSAVFADHSLRRSIRKGVSGKSVNDGPPLPPRMFPDALSLQTAIHKSRRALFELKAGPTFQMSDICVENRIFYWAYV